MAVGNNGRRINRRTILQGTAGVIVALPFLESLAGGEHASAQLRPGGPTRLFAFSHVQGFAMGDSMPDASYNLPPVLAALEPVKNKVLVLSGIDNRVGGGGHNETQRSQFTAKPAYGSDEYSTSIFAAGPSIDEVIANRIANGGARRRLDLAIRYGSVDPVDSIFFWHGDADAVTHIGDPHEAFRRVFGAAPGGMPEPQIDLLRLRRRSVLDTVLGHFNGLRSRVSVADRDRLDQHADKIRQLEQALDDMPMLSNLASCEDRPALPDVSDPSSVVPQISNALVDIAVLATACGVSDVTTMMLNEARYEWLGSTLIDEQIAAWENRYHILYHEFCDGGNNGAPRDVINLVNAWNVSLFARYLRGLDAIMEADGSTALDHTLAIYIPEFGNGGGHASGNLPVILAGNLADVPMGRYLKLESNAESSYASGGSKPHNQVLVSVLNAFGDTTDSFGDYPSGIARGPLTDL
jgi:hypothetical protein